MQKRLIEDAIEGLAEKLQLLRQKTSILEPFLIARKSFRVLSLQAKRLTLDNGNFLALILSVGL